jgi:hypothetical protein
MNGPGHFAIDARGFVWLINNYEPGFSSPTCQN